ncbi:hypothetical protein HPB47_021096 [Ixodes persulcatus]|uniref:Uncharacterized protein n=1 Tax=Ixodes persulcatus TaxID=34615 RepID=A0AC60QFI9_IXOPE|nr:hypothetical protein HPB47_021096 [Ixodes persulcatus]
MAADESFAEFVHLVLSAEDILYDDAGDSQSRHPLGHFSERDFLVRYRFTKATIANMLLSLPLEESARVHGLPSSPMLQLLVALSFYGAGTFHVVTGNIVNMPQLTPVFRLLAWTLFNCSVKFPDGAENSNVFVPGSQA